MMFVDETHDWDRLTLYLSRDVLERRYQALHKRELGAEKAKEIISHLDQARQYFKSADSAGVLAGPLEQYYGVLAFSRAIVLYLNSSIREASLKPGHGLKANLPSDGGVEDIQLKVQGGTFDELLDATGNIEQVIVDQPHPRREILQSVCERSLPRPQIDATFSLVELLTRIPGLRRHFEESFGLPAHCYEGAIHLMGNALNVTVWRDRFDLPAIEVLKNVLGINSRASGAVTHLGGAQFIATISDGENLASFVPNTFTARSGARYLVECYSGGWSLSGLASYFAASHALSMLVRYYPSRWARMVNHEKGDRLLPVLDRMRGLVQTEFVRLALGELERAA
jgi:hypothetical protein